MKYFAIAVLASLLPFTSAVPLEKRVLVVQTVTNVVVQTIDVTTTVWVDPGRPTNQPEIKNYHAHLKAHKNKLNNKYSPPAQKAAPAPAPAQPQSSPPEVHNPHPVQQQAAPVIPQTPKQAAYVPQPAPPAPLPPAPAQAPQAPQAQAPTPAPVLQAPAPVAAAKHLENAHAGFGSTEKCGQVGMPCSGDITFYDTGLGACGTTDDGLNDNVFALAHGMMGAQSNGNPFCGRKAEVSLDGKTVVGRLVDKCGGCEGQSIDLSHKMFQALANEDRGRISGVKWHFID
ncbi:MAG: hypothetical protein Q9213_006902 [Squamulea squamosa]